MRGNGKMWKGVPHVYLSTKPFYLLSKNQARIAGWAITGFARVGYTGSGIGGDKYRIYHLGYCRPIKGEAARRRRIAAGFPKERVRQIRKNYPKQLSFFGQQIEPPNIIGSDLP